MISSTLYTAIYWKKHGMNKKYCENNIKNIKIAQPIKIQ